MPFVNCCIRVCCTACLPLLCVGEAPRANVLSTNALGLRSWRLQREDEHGVSMPQVGGETLSDYLRTCQNLSGTPANVFKIPPPRTGCRTGCALVYVERAIHFAEAIESSMVEVPATDDFDRNPLFDLPRLIPVRTDRARHCNFVASPHTSFFCTVMFNLGSYCESSVKDKQDIFQHILKRYLKKEVLSACEAPSEDEVTVHIRNGDVAQINSGAHGQPPCSFYDIILRTGFGGRPFPRVRLIFSPPRNDVSRTRSVCLDYVIQLVRELGVVLLPAMDAKGVQKNNGSMVQDFCNLLKAKNLILPPSNFNLVAAMMNTDLIRLFYFRPYLQTDIQIENISERTFVHDHNWDLGQVCHAFPRSIQFSLNEDVTQPRQNPFTKQGWSEMCWCHGQSERPWSRDEHTRLISFFSEYPASMLNRTQCDKPVPSVSNNMHHSVLLWFMVALVPVFLWVALSERVCSSERVDMLAAMLCWMLSNTMMNVLNKKAADNFQATALLVMMQMIFADVMILAMNSRSLKAGSWKDLASWMVVPFLFAGMLSSSMFALKETTVTTVLVLRNLLPLFSFAVEHLILRVPQHSANSTLASMFVTITGAIIFGYTNLAVTKYGVFLIIINCITTVCDRLLQRTLLKKEGWSISLPMCMAINNSVGLLPMLAFAWATREIKTWPDTVKDASFAAWYWVVMASILGLCLGMLGLRCQKLMSATTFLMMQNSNKGVVIFLSMVVFGDAFNFPSAIGCTMSLVGSLWYGYLTLPAAKPQTRSEGQGSCDAAEGTEMSSVRTR